MRMKYYTREMALNIIWHYCPSKFGFEHAFAQTTTFFLRGLIDCIDNHAPLYRITYDEPVDFLDGNGFIIEGDEDNGYTIMPIQGGL